MCSRDCQKGRRGLRRDLAPSSASPIRRAPHEWFGVDAYVVRPPSIRGFSSPSRVPSWTRSLSPACPARALRTCNSSADCSSRARAVPSRTSRGCQPMA
jgi:hypothetical protein